MFSDFLSGRLARYSRFSLRGFFVGITLASIGFVTWWRWPAEIERVPPELGRVPEKFYPCATSLWQTALWIEEAPKRTTPTKVDPFAVDPAETAGGHIYAASGQCQARRDWQAGWILDGPAEVFTKKGTRVIRAEFARGKLHGEFCSWFTSGQVRETGRYYRGQKDGVWELCDQFTGKVKTHEEYERGQKSGIWLSNRGREHFHNGKLLLRERAESYTGNWAIEEHDANEKLQLITYWNKARDQQLGVDHFAAGHRHGSWYRVEFEDQRPFVSRGQWLNGLPSGEWVYEREDGPPERLEFRQGALIAVNGEPVCDVLLQRLTGGEDDDSRREELLRPGGESIAWYERQSVFDRLYEYYWRRPRVDPQLVGTQADFLQIWQQELPSDFFEYENLPTSAVFCLILRGANLALDYRFGEFWITTPQLAAAWRDETGTQPWFEKIINTPWIWTKDAGGISRVVDSPFRQRDLHFGEDWLPQWQAERKLEFLQPLTCSLGTARRLDGSQVTAPRTLQLPEELLEHHSSDEYYRFDEFIALECEANQCRLVLRGDTLVMEPR